VQWTELVVAAHERRLTGRWAVHGVPEEVAEAWWAAYGEEEAGALPFNLGGEAARQIARQEAEQRAVVGSLDRPAVALPGPAERLWAEILKVLEITTTPAVYQHLLATSRAIRLQEGNGNGHAAQLLVEVGNDIARERLNGQLGHVVARAVQAAGAEPVEVHFVARNSNVQEGETADD